MTSLKTIASLFCLLALCAVTTWSKHKKPGPGPADTCGHTYTASNGTIRAYNRSSTLPKDKPCSWTIYYKSNNSEQADVNHTIFLVFDEILLGDEDTVTIYVDDKPLNIFDKSTLSTFVGAFSILTGKSNITITVDPTGTPEVAGFVKSLQVSYFSNSECMHTFDKTKSGIFQSPMYDLKSSSFPIDCSFKFAVPAKDEHYMNLWFETIEFDKGEISVNGALKNDGKYQAIPVEFLVKDILELNITIPEQSPDPEMFKLKYIVVTKGCSSVEELSTSQPKALQSPKKDALRQILSTQEQSLSCLWLVQTDEGQTLTLTIQDATNLPQTLDKLLVLDGPNRTSKVLLDLNFGQKANERVLYSTGRYLWISATSPFVSEDFFVDIEVSKTKSGGHLVDHGTVTIDDDRTTYLLNVQEEQQVKLVIDWSGTKLKDGSSVNFYKDFLKTTDPFMRLQPGQTTDIVVSPTEKMAIVVSGFDSSTFQGSFYGIEKGCYKYGEGSGDTFSVSGHCNSTCAWIVQPFPTSKDLLTFHFQTVNLYQGDRILIRKLDPSQTLVANVSFPSSHFPDLWLPVETGAFVQLTRSSCPSENTTVIESSYQISSSACGTTLAPGLNDVVVITSPGYPSHYPLGADCTWTILKPPNAVFLHVTIRDLRLTQEKHVLQILSGTDPAKLLPVFTSNSTKKELPDDMPVFDGLTVRFTTNTDTPQESLPGFKMEVAVVGRGGVLTGVTGKVETPSFPQTVEDSLLSVWFATVNSTESQEQILEFEFDNRTNLPAVEGLLKIYDGPSLRSPLLSNLTNDTAFSRTSRLLLVYLKTTPTPQPGFSLTYQTHMCNMSMLCDNGICMHEDWFCNGINDCGDYSDERDCEGGFAPRPPIPPTPPPKEDVKGANAGVLGGSIAASFVVGIFLGITIPMACRHWRSRQLFNYGAVSSVNDQPFM